MIGRFRDYVRQHHMIEEGDLVLAGVSGGADSVCLLLLLEQLQKEIPFLLEVIHVEHGIRGEESKEDAAFVERLCRAHQMPCRQVSLKTPSYAKEGGLGIEEAARILRYQAFYGAAQEAVQSAGDETARVSIALAHHMEDQAETVLFQMSRGSREAGLCGMLPVRIEEGVRIIRPLLAVRRRDIESYLEEQGQPYRTDVTNQSLQYSRNRIRKQVIPVLSEINTQAVLHIAQMAEHMCGVRDYLKSQAEASKGSIWEKTGNGVLIRIPLLLQCHDVLADEILHDGIVLAAGKQKDVTYAHVCACKKLALAQSGKSCMLPYGVIARREYDQLLLFKSEDKQEREAVVVSEETLAELECSCRESAEGVSECLRIPQKNGNLEIVVQKGCLLEEINKNTYTKCLDYDKMKGGFVVRTRLPGDYLVIDSLGHRKLLKKYLIEQKFPRSVREQLPVIACGQEIVWVVGGRNSETYRASEGTSYVLKFVYHGGNQDGTQNFSVSDRGTVE